LVFRILLSFFLSQVLGSGSVVVVVVVVVVS
jgi:hypothetical protein